MDSDDFENTKHAKVTLEAAVRMGDEVFEMGMRNMMRGTRAAALAEEPCNPLLAIQQEVAADNDEK